MKIKNIDCINVLLLEDVDPDDYEQIAEVLNNEVINRIAEDLTFEQYENFIDELISVLDTQLEAHKASQ
jgi:hypothetical protein